MFSDPASRWVIIGNSGSGKSTLAEHLGTVLRLPTYDLDLIHWRQGGQKRDEIEAKAQVAEIAASEAWVIEGVYGWLAEVALSRAHSLVWLDPPWDECRAGLLKRGLRRGMTQSDQDALLAWAEAYWHRTSPSSFYGHCQMFHGFTGRKIRLQSREEVVAFAPQAAG